jgi:YTH domain-containing family protein
LKSFVVHSLELSFTGRDVPWMCSGYSCQFATELSLYSLYVLFQVAQADSGGYLCYLPGYENGYASYNPVVPGVDGQYVSKEPYYSTAISMQDHNAPGIFSQPIAFGSELVPAYSWGPSFVLHDGVQGHPVGVHQTNYPARPKYSSNKHAIPSSKATRSAKYAPDTIKGSSSALDTVPNSANNNPSSKGANKVPDSCKA